jgi:hypothetical protein
MTSARGSTSRTRCGELGADVRLGVVDDRMHGVEAQPVDVEVAHPLLGVLIAHSRTPRCA